MRLFWGDSPKNYHKAIDAKSSTFLEHILSEKSWIRYKCLTLKFEDIVINIQLIT